MSKNNCTRLPVCCDGKRNVTTARLKRVFGIEIDRCARCGGQLTIIASIEDRQVIAEILSHLECLDPQPHQSELPLRGRKGQISGRVVGWKRDSPAGALKFLSAA